MGARGVDLRQGFQMVCTYVAIGWGGGDRRRTVGSAACSCSFLSPAYDLFISGRFPRQGENVAALPARPPWSIIPNNQEDVSLNNWGERDLIPSQIAFPTQRNTCVSRRDHEGVVGRLIFSISRTLSPTKRAKRHPIPLPCLPPSITNETQWYLFSLRPLYSNHTLRSIR